MARTRTGVPAMDILSPPTEADLARASAAPSFEGDILDVVNMAGIAADLIERAFESPMHMANGQRTFEIGEAEANRLLFSVYHLLSMTEAFRDKYESAVLGAAVN